MPRPATDKRERLADAALELAYQQGFERASIADVAARAGVAPGSVYYYFKTKDDVGHAVVERLASRYDAAMQRWTEQADPTERLAGFIRSYLDDLDAVRAYGCPLGSVCAELGKQSPELGTAAGEVFGRLLAWAASQFCELGLPADDARQRAVHLVATMQGAATLTRALDSPAPLQQEATRLLAWLDTLEAAQHR